MLPTLLVGLVGGGLVAGAVMPATASEHRPAVATPVVMAADAPWAAAEERDEQRRASRGRQPERSTSMDPEPVPTTGSPVPAEEVRPPLPAAPAVPPPVAPTLPGCSGKRPDVSKLANGRIPVSALCTLPGDSAERLRPDAAIAFVRLAAGYQERFGEDICVTDGYRTLGEQEQLRRAKPGLSARPGKTEHGWGLAVDLACGVQSYRSDRHAWLIMNAQTYGWFLPAWAQRDGSKPEPWHWEFAAP